MLSCVQTSQCQLRRIMIQNIQPANKSIHIAYLNLILFYSHVQPQLKDKPVQAVCPVCGQTVTTETSYKIGNLNCFWAAILFLVFHSLPCIALIPCCLPCLMDVKHKCPNDDTVIGVYKRRTPF